MSIPKPKEGDIVKACLEYLVFARHWTAWRNNTGGLKVGDRLVRFGSPGSGDIFCLLPPRLLLKEPGGRFCSIEVKRKGNKPTDLQLAWMDRVREAGGLAFVCRSVQDLIDGLTKEGY